VSNDKPTVKQPQRYWRALTEANPKFEWLYAIPDCPWEFFVQMIVEREQAHPEAAVPTVEYRAARMFSGDAVWHSEKINNIQPVAWRAEFAWLYSLALADGTFEAEPRLVWSTAYAYNRPDWTVAKVGKLLDEFERVGLLERTRTSDGKVWGRWVGAKLLPTAKTIAQSRLKVGRGDLFESGAPCNNEQQVAASCSTSAALEQQLLGVGVGLGEGLGEGKGQGLDAAKSSENEQPQKTEQVKSASEEVKGAEAITVAPKPEAFTSRIEYAAACHAAGVLPVSRAVFKSREVLPKDEYLHEKSKPAVAAAVAEFAAEIAQREPCPVCHVPHPKPFCKKPEPLAAKANA
jgi:hypothetical protein